MPWKKSSVIKILVGVSLLLLILLALLSGDSISDIASSSLEENINRIERKIYSMDIKIDKGNYKANEDIKIHLGRYVSDKLEIYVVDSLKRKTVLNYKVEGTDVVILAPKHLPAGKSTLQIKDGTKLIYSQNFEWGVLALNTTKSAYTVGETAEIQMAVLDDQGEMVCNANTTLYIYAPDNTKTTLSTTDKTIIVTDFCDKKEFTLEPDYKASYKFEKKGKYRLELTAETKNGTKTITEEIDIKESLDFEINRVTATRIYPVLEYPVTLNIKANRDFDGTIEEYIPDSFTLKDFDVVKPTITNTGIVQTLSYKVNLKKGETFSPKYSYDAPDDSPQFFTLGKISIKEGDKEIYKEDRLWQIAVDSAGASFPTRLYTTGFELNSVTAGMEWNTNTGTAPTISSSTKRTGDYALRTNPSGATSYIQYIFAAADNATRTFLRAYIRVPSYPSGLTEIVSFVDTANTIQSSVQMTTSGTLRLFNNEDSAQIGSDTAALSVDTWYRVELETDFGSAGTGDSIVVARLDGVQIASSTTTNFANGIGRFNLGAQATTSIDIFYDDIGLNQDAYTNQNSWPGEGSIIDLRPNGDGTNVAWTGNPTNGTNEYQNVDEETPDDATSKVSCTANAQVQDLALENASSKGVGTTDRIKSAEAWVRSLAAAGARSHTVILTNSGGTGDTGAATSLNIASWQTNDDADPRNAEIVNYDEPGATNYAPLSTSIVDGMLVKMTSTDCSPVYDITAVWVYVEYVPAEGGRVYSSGFELQSITADMEWTTINGSPTIITGTKRSGEASMQVVTLGSGTREAVNFQFVAANANGPYFLRAYIYITTAPSAENTIIDFRNSSSTIIARITMDNSRQLQLRDEDGTIGSVSSALSTTTWYRVELKVDASGGASADTVEAKLDGTVFGTSSTRDLSTGVYQFGLGGNLNAEAQTTGDWLFDDVALNQNVGTTQNGYPGAGKIVHLQPNADGTNVAWTGTSVNGANEYQNMDEVTPNDITDYNGSSTINILQDADFEPTSTYSISSTTDEIILVSPGVRFRTSAAATMGFSVSLLDTSTGPQVESSQIMTATTTWFTNNNTAPRVYPLTTYTAPAQSTAWTTSKIDSAQIRLREVTDTASTIQVSAVWILVEYKPAVITISGTCDAFDETTDCTDTGTVKVAVNTSVASQEQITVAGTWQIDEVPKPTSGDVITVWIGSAADTDEAATVTQYDGTGNITGLKLYKEHLTIGSDDLQNLTNTELSTYDNSVSTNEDIFFDVDTGVLYVDDTSQSTTEKLTVLPGNTYTPGGNLTTHDIDNQGDFVPGSNTITIQGSYSNQGTFTKGTSNINMTGTTTETLSGTLSGAGGQFYNLTFNGSGGAWSFGSNPPVEVANDLTITLGTLTSSSTTLTITGNYSNSGTFTHNSGTVIFNATDAGNTLAGTLSGTTGKFYNLTFDGVAGAWSFTSNPAVEVANNFTITNGTVTSTSNTLTVTGNYSNSGTFTHNSGTTLFNATDAGNTLAGTMSSTSKFYNLSFNGSGGAWSFTSNPAVTVDNDFTITNGTVTSTSHASGLTITGNYSNLGTFTHNSGKVIFNASDTGNTLGGNLSGTSKFYNLIFNGGASPTWSFTSNPNVEVLNNLDLFTGTVTFTSSILTIGGNLFIDTGYASFNHNNGTVLMNATDAGNTLSGSSSFYNLTFDGVSGAWSFDSDPAVTVANDLTITNGTLTSTSHASGLTISGNYSNSGTFTHNSGLVKFNATDAGNTIAGTLSGATGKFYNLTFDGVSGAWSFTSNPAVEVANDLTITNGTLTSTSHVSGLTVTGNYSNSGTFTHNSGTMIFNATDAGNTLAGTMSGGSSFYNLTFSGAAGAWSFTSNPAVTVANALSISNGTLTATSGTTTIGGNFTKTGGTFTHNSGTVVFNDNTKVSTLTYNADTTFSAFTVSTASKQMKFDNVDKTTIAGTFTVSGGACGTKVQLYSDSDTNQFDIDATGTKSVTYADIQDSNAITAISATNSVAGAGGNNTNWTITADACGATISVSGVCYAFDEVTGCGDTGTITIAFGNSVQAQTEATVSASWTVTGMTQPLVDTIVTIYIDGAADTDEAIAVTKYDGTGDITGVKLYKENLTIGSIDNQTLSNSELGTFDNSVSGDEDIFFDVTTNNLVVDSTAQSSTEKLTIISGNTHQPGGNVTTHDLTNLGTFLPQGNTITIAGSYLNSGTVTSSTSQFNMTGTTTETLAGNLSGTSKLYNLTFNGSGGAWSFTSNPTVEIYNDLTITLGTVTSTSGNLAVGGNYSNSGTFTHNSGTVVFNGNHTSNTLAGTLSGSSSFYNLKFDKCPVVSSPVSFWNFEEGTGGTTADNCTNAFTGTLGTGGTTPTWTTGKYGNGLSFDGNDYVNMGSHSALQLNYTDSFSFSSWVNTPSLPTSGNYPMVMNQTGPDSSYGAFQYTILFNGDDSGKLCVSVGRAMVGGNSVCVASPTSINTWYHVMGVYNGTDLAMYVDGTYVNTVTYSQGAASAPAGDLIIGGSNNNFYYTGKIDNPAVYNYVLTPAQVIEDMNRAGGGWSYTSNPNVAVLNNFTITNGIHTSTSGNLTITNNYSNLGTFTHNSGTVVMNATDAGNTLSGIMSGSPGKFYNLTFNGSGGAWSFTSNPAVEVANNFTITLGTVTSTSATLTVTGNYSNSGTFTHNSGITLFNATDSGNTIAGNLSGTSKFYNLTFNGSGGAWSFTSNPAVEVNNDLTITNGTVTATNNTLTITGNYSNAGTFTNNGGTVVMNATDAGNTLSGTMTTTSSFASLTFNGSGGGWSFGANSTTVTGNFTITLGTVTAPSTTLTISGNYSNAGTFTHNSGSVVMDGIGITDPTLYWNYQENTGTAIGSRVGGGQSGTTTGTAWASGVYDYALDYNGSDRTYASNRAISATDNFTMMAWVNVTSLPQASLFMYNGSDTAGYGIGITNGWDGTGSELVALYGNVTWFGAGYTLPTNQWLHITLVRESGTAKFYVNGVQTSGTNTNTPGSPADFFEVGNEPGQSRYFNGKVDEPKVYNYALTQSQVKSAMYTYYANTLGYTMSGNMTTTSSFNNLTFNGTSGVWDFGANSATVANDLTITAGSVVAPSTTLTVTGNYSNSGTFTHNNGTVIFNATDSGNTIAGTLSGATGKFYNLTFDGVSGAWSFTSNPAVEVANNLTITNGTLTSTSHASGLTVTGNYSNSGTFTHNSGTVIFNATDAGNTLAGTLSSTSSFYNLTFNGVSGAWSFTANPAVEVANDLTITNGTLTSTSHASGLTVTGNYSNSGTFTHNSGTMIFNATDAGNTLAGTLSGASSFYNLTFSGAAGAWSFTSNPAVTIANALSISNGTLTATSGTTTIGGNFTKTGGTFTHNSGTVVFNDNTKVSTLTYNADTTFSAFTVTTPSKQMKFDNVDKTTIAGALTISGSACGTKVELHSDSDTNQFDIDATSTVSITYADIQDSNAITALSATTSVAGAGGNNTNWTITAGACGPAISISGVCYAFDEVTGCGDTGTITIAFGNSVQAQTEPTVSASWTVSGMTSPDSGTIVTIYIDGAADTDEAIAVTKYDGTGDITGVKLYKENLTIGSLDNQTLSNSDIGTYDNSVSGDEDIFFDVTTNNLVVDSTTQSTTEKLTIVSGNTHQPGGTVSTHDLSNIGTFLPQGNTITIAGSYLNSGTLTSSTSQFDMTGTTSETLAGTLSGATGKFYNITFNGSGGAWSFTSNPAVEVANDFIITLGTVTSTSNTLTVTGNYSNSGTFTHGSGTVTMNATDAGNTLAGTLSGATGKFYNLTFNGSGGAWSFTSNPAVEVANDFIITLGTVTSTSNTLTVTGNYSNSGTFTHGSGTVTFNATDAGNTIAGTLSGATGKFYNLTFNGSGGAWSFTSNPAVEVANDFIITLGTVTSTSNTLTITGNYSNSGTFTHGSGAVTFNATDTGNTIAGTLSGTTGKFYNLTFNGVLGAWSFTSNPAVEVANDLTITNGTLTSTSNASGLIVAGNYSNSGTFTNNSGTVYMTATDAGNTLAGTMTTTSAFHNLIFNGAGGAWGFSADATINETFGINAGTVTAPSGTLTIKGNYTNKGTFTNNSGLVDMNSTSTGNLLSGTMTGSSKFNNLTFTGSTATWQFSQGVSEWAKSIGGSSGEEGKAITTDSSGNVFTTGYFNGATMDFNDSGGTDNHSTNGQGDVFLTKYGSDGSYGWTKTFGGTSQDTGYGIATDSSGNIYVVGSFWTSNVDFNDSGGTDNHSSNGSSDVFITKYNSDGSYGWTRTFGGTTADVGYGITIDSSNNVYVTGYYQGTNVDFDDAGGTDNNTSNGGFDIFITKYASDGSYGWTRTFGGTTNDEGNGIATDSSSNVYVTGYFEGTTVDFDDAGGTDNKTSNGYGDIFITKYASDGSYGWTRAIGGTTNSSDIGRGISTDSSGNVYTTGNFRGTNVDFDDAGGTDNKSTDGFANIYINKYASDGSYGWTKTFGASGTSDEGYSIKTDTLGNIYAIGQFKGTNTDFDDSSGTDLNTSFGNGDIYLTKINADGSYGWTRTGGSNSADDAGFGIATDTSNNVYITGKYWGTNIDFDLTGGINLKSSNGSSEIYITKLGLPSENAEVANNLTIASGAVTAPQNSLIVTGNYSNSGTFTHNSGTVKFDATDSGNTIAGTLSGSTGKFYNLTFDGVSGAWSFTSNPAVEVANNLTITNGTLTSTSHASGLTVTGNYSNAGTFTHNSGTVTFNATDAGNTLAGTLSSTSSFYNLIFNGSGGAWSFTSNPAVEVANDFTITAGTVTSTSNILTITGNYSNSGTFTHNSGTITMNATDPGNTLAGTLSSTSSFYNLTFNGSGGDWSFTSNPAVEVANDFTITAGTVTSTSANFTVTGNYSNSGTFTHNSGTMIFNATDAGNTLAGTLSGATGMFYNLTFNGSGGAWSFTSNPAVEVNNDLTITAGTLTSTSNASGLKITGNYSNSGTFTHNSGNVNFNSTATKTLAGNMSGTSAFYGLQFSGTGAWSFTSNPNVDVLDYFQISNSSANVTSTSATLKVSGNFRNSFNTTTFVHNNGTVKFDATDAGNTITSTSTLSFYNVIFDGVGGAWQLPTGASTSVNNDLTITNGAVSPVGAGYSLNIYGNYLNNGTFTNNGGTVVFAATDTGNTIGGTLSGANGKFYNLTFSGVGGEWSFTSNPTVEVEKMLSLSNGTLTSTSGNLSIGTSFSKTGGTFTHNSGTITFVDSSANGSVRINTGTTFNNITVATPNKAILFDETDTVTVIGTFTINGSACGTPVLIKSWTNGNQADIDLQGTVSVDYASIEDSNAITAATANNSVVGAGGNNTNWTINGGACNSAPNSPTSLAQKTTGDVVIVTGGWNNTTSIKFTATADDPNNPDTISLCVEYQQLGTGFTNTETGCGTGVAYSGTPVTVTVTLNSIPDAFEYHWQARLKDTAGAYSAWVSYDVNAESARDYGIDTTAPTLSTINDGTSCGSDVTFNDGSLSTISACWAQATATVSGLAKYQYSIGTTAGATDVLTWTDLVDGSANVSLTINSLTLQTSQQYYINVKAVDNATNTSGVISTNGQLVAPTISFSLNSSAVTFANLNGSNSYTDTKTSTLTTSTNAYNGYVVRAYKTQLLTNTANPSFTIPDFSGGSYAAPSEWSGTGYGYSSSDTSIQGAGKFPGSGACLGTGNAPCYAPFSSTAPGDIVADHTATVSGSPISSEQFTITYKVATPATQAGGQYTTTIIYTIVPQY